MNITQEIPKFVDETLPTISLETILPGIRQQLEEAEELGAGDEIRRSVEDYVKIAKFSSRIGIPFCVEYNPYYRSPHAVLHEIGHWAVKPDSYIEVYRTLSRRDFKVHMADLVVDEPYGEHDVVSRLTYYRGDNDRMPDWDLLEGQDPTPNEKAVRAWTRHAISQLGLDDPIHKSRRTAYTTQGIGDTLVAKGSSFRTWAPCAVNSPVAIAEMEAFQLNPANGIFRPPQDSLVLPHLNPASLSELEENVDAMAAQYPERVFAFPGQVETWREQIAWKYKGVLAHEPAINSCHPAV